MYVVIYPISFRYVCDPVLGDHNQYYVPAGLVKIFRTELIPRLLVVLIVKSVITSILILFNS